MLSVAFFIKDRRAHTGDSERDRRVRADAYRDSTWTASYFEEFRKCSDVSWEPYVYWRRDPFPGKFINIDSSGVRNTENFASPSSSSPFRILMFGGSTLWGTGARDQYTIPSLLSAELRQHGFEVEVTNYGESGYVSTQDVISLIIHLQREDAPQLVIFYDGVNDTYSAYQEQVAGLPQNETNRVVEFNLSKPAALGRRLAMDARDSAEKLSTARFLNGALKRVGVQWQGRFASKAPQLPRRSKSSSPDELAKDVVETYWANVEVVTALADHYGFQHLSYWQPTVFQKEHRTDYEEEKRREVQAFEEHFRKTYAELSSHHLTSVPAYHFQDLSHLFSSINEPLYVDW
ncbi:MAG TPA: SGNH/GDSL hydrolase family protein, partial [bacterium]|nr:SGNH/GDSL hydrolase family protein [bacterium]